MEQSPELGIRGGDQDRARRSHRLRLLLVVAGFSGALVLMLVAVGVGYALYGSDTNVSRRATGGGTKVIPVELKDFDVTPGTLIVDRGTHVVLGVTNTGNEGHNLAFERGGLHTRTLSHGQSQHLDLGTVTRDVQVVCTLPLHESLGMKLHIQIV